MIDLEYIRERYSAERPSYDALATYACEKLRKACYAAGLSPKMEGRSKDLGSLLKKALSKSKTYDEIIDKAGIRATVYDSSHRDKVRDIALEIFDVNTEIDKDQELLEVTLKIEKFGYRGLHLRAKLRNDDRPDLQGFAFELQIRTMGASLWADISHDLTYKTPDGGVPRDVDRAILRLAAVLELVDQEVDRVRQIVSSAKDAAQQAILLAVEKQFLQLAARDYDRELTAALLPQLMWIAGDGNPDEFVAKLNEFFTRCREKLEFVFEQYRDVDLHPVLHQPEGLLILYAREYREFDLHDRWPPLLPESEREDFEAIWQPSRG